MCCWPELVPDPASRFAPTASLLTSPTLVSAAHAGTDEPGKMPVKGAANMRADADMQIETALKKAGVKVERKNYPGVTHEFFGMVAVVAKAKDAQMYAGQRLKQAFGGR